MIRLLLVLAAAVAAAPQQKSQEKASQPAVQEVEPPEEDESLKPKEYSFNPIQASKELGVGNFYFKRGSYKAASMRFEEATRWDPGMGDAYLRWADAAAKLNDKAKVKEVLSKFLEMAPDHKRAPEIRKKLGK